MNRTLRERALALLARREHARAELRRKLAPHADSAEELEGLLDALTAERLLSDARYAQARVDARGGRLGDARLAHELRTRGVADDEIDAALAAVGSELDRARAVWRKKFGALPGDRAEWARQARFLQARGFSGESIRRVLGGDEEHQ
jgi:regulatory protein